MDIKKIITKKVLYAILAVVLALLVFQVGMFVGYKKAQFSFGWGDNYFSTFGKRDGRPIPRFPGEDLSNPHGVAGKIIKIALPNLIIEDQDKVEKIVVIKDDSSIKQFRDEIKSTDLKVGDFVVVIGAPDDKSQIEAKLIRLMPDPAEVGDELLPPLGESLPLPPPLPSIN